MLLLDQVALDSKGQDFWVWTPEKAGRFSVKSCTRELDKSSPAIPAINFQKIWKGVVPHRIEIFIWFALLGKINTRAMLSWLGIIPISEAMCVFCKKHVETIDHLFIHCEFSRGLWMWWMSLWELSWVIPLKML